MLNLQCRYPMGKGELSLDTTLPAQGTTAIFGVSGAGKSTLINIIAGLVMPVAGQVVFNDTIFFHRERKICLPPEKRRVGYVFQEARLFPHYPVEGNLLYGDRKKNRHSFKQLVTLLGLQSLLSRYPSSLSGGEKQRVAIGRALLSDPHILLMDEPLASLDLPRKREVLPWLQNVVKQLQIPLLYVTHSLDEIAQLADHVVVLEEGKIIAEGATESVWLSDVMRQWITDAERSTLLSLKVIEHHSYYAMTALGFGDHLLWVNRIDKCPGTALRVRVVASDITLLLQKPQNSSIRNTYPAWVDAVQQSGSYREVCLRTGGHKLWARITAWAYDELAIKPGLLLYMQINTASVID
ncbi:MAG: Sulfate/thiosulfate import ATP-binding protein CysA [Candidatus Erwinia impunctatus]|nr:Sulfate/thiosulfate import ATP-binding protein CysA [Culicoides impunctatus]